MPSPSSTYPLILTGSEGPAHTFPDKHIWISVGEERRCKRAEVDVQQLKGKADRNPNARFASVLASSLFLEASGYHSTTSIELHLEFAEPLTEALVGLPEVLANLCVEL